MGAAVNVDNVDPPESWSLEGVEAWLILQVAEIQSNKKTFLATADLFEQGLDSLGATILRHRVVGALQSSNSPNATLLVTQSTVYENPSISKLARFILGAVMNPDHRKSSGSRAEEIERMIKKFSSAPPTATAPAKWDAADDNHFVVLITGT